MRQLALIFLICFALVFGFKYFSEKMPLEESVRLAAIQSLLFSAVFCLLSWLSPQKKLRKKKNAEDNKS